VSAAAAPRPRQASNVLDEAPGVRAMTWVLAIMLFLTVLAAALGLSTRNATASLSRQLAGRLTVQVSLADPARRDAAAARALAVLRADPLVAGVRAVPRAELARLLAPWLGVDGSDPELPIPALIDVDLRDDAPATAAAIATRLAARVPEARVERHEAWMSPVSSFMALVTGLAALLVLLMAAASAAVVVLATRAGLDAHRPTIEVMHMLGSTDVQVARLFQRRIARDAAVGGLVGGLAALLVVAFLGSRAATLGSDLLGGLALGAGGWIALGLLPLAFVALAAAAARVAVTLALRRTL
jgi:cell division transport system permease protein